MKLNRQALYGWIPMSTAVARFLLSATLVTNVSSMAYLEKPRSRNYYANQEGVMQPRAGAPYTEWCPHCLNRNDGVCGKTSSANYDNYLDSLGNPMPWSSQELYIEGQYINIYTQMNTHHYGHMEIAACPDGQTSGMECFQDIANRLEFVSDNIDGMPRDDNYPERGYYARRSNSELTRFEMTFRLPLGIAGDQVMLHWRYITANSCNPPGYSDYFGGGNSKNQPLSSEYWVSGLPTCSAPYPNDGTTGPNWPEQFFNCAEVTIIPDWVSTPAPVTVTPVTNAPVTAPPTTAPVTVTPVTDAPITAPPTTAMPSISKTSAETTFSCSDGVGISTWDALEAMQSLAYTVKEDNPYTRSIIASGGAAGSGYVVSEGQAYGLLTAALALASMEESNAHYETAKNEFEGYFNGWKQMCENSSSSAPCQSTKYCNNGQYPCLPGWKHNGDLGTVIGTGAAPDADADAIVGMIIAVKAVEDDAVLPSWHDDVSDWADRSCTQFLADHTELSSSGEHRLLKLGTCWGGWEQNGNNPSYHSPGSYRMMRDFQAAYSSRTYTMPSFGDSLSLTEKWQMLIDTSYKFLETTQCPDTGLVPNWALVEEVDESTLTKYPGSFTGSGTPQREYGSEASRTMWRITLDAIVYPDESASQAGSFLAALQDKMVQYFDDSPATEREAFGEDTLQVCDYVDSVFSSWQYNGFIFAPVYSTLASGLPEESFEGKSFTQQDMVNAACGIVSDGVTSASYYSRSWQVISTMTLNGELERVGHIMRGESAPVPSLAPVTAPPTTATPSISKPSAETMFSCSDGVGASTWEALEAMKSLTYTVKEDNPYTLSIISSGGVAGSGGDVESKGQGYGLLTAALALASMDESNTHYETAKNEFEGYFNGWKQMCENSSSSAPCQSTKYCNNGQYPCLPGWKHNGDLENVLGTGAAPDADADAIVGMIIAVKAVEDDAVLPSWHDDVSDWADRSCTQFLADHTELSSSGEHRLLKLGTCWGGWEHNGNNPSYHSPGSYRMMRDFQAAYSSRTYTMPSFGDSLSLTEKWQMLIDTSYKFLETTQCPDTGLVPNWALVEEFDESTLTKYPGSFTGSGTPQYAFGYEASRTMWRITLDAIVYPDESASQAGSFLAALQDKMVQYFDDRPATEQEAFGEDTLQVCDYVDSVFSSWQYNGFIFAPVYSTLASGLPEESFEGKSFTQQDMVNAACGIVSGDLNGLFYSRSWQVISTMTLNGELERVGKIMRGESVSLPPTTSPVTPAPVTSAPVTSSPVVVTDAPVSSLAPVTAAPVVVLCDICEPKDGEDTPECSDDKTEGECLQLMSEGKCQWTECVVYPTPGFTAAPVAVPCNLCQPSLEEANSPECNDKTETECHQLISEGKCQWTECSIPPTVSPTTIPTEKPTPNPTDQPTRTPTEDPTSTPTLNPTLSPTASPLPLLCKNWCRKNTQPWTKKCNWKNCNGCAQCI